MTFNVKFHSPKLWTCHIEILRDGVPVKVWTVRDARGDTPAEARKDVQMIIDDLLPFAYPGEGYSFEVGLLVPVAPK
jgi:hypothetical protein